MKKQAILSISPLYISWMLLFSALVCIGCSSKSNEPNEDKTVASLRNITQKTQSQDPNQLKQQNEELRETIAKVLPYLEETKKLKQENEKLNKSVSEILALKKEMERLKQENKTLKQSVAKLTRKKETTAESHYQDKDTQKVQTTDLVAKFDSAGSVEEKLKFLKSLTKLSLEGHKAVIDVAQKALDDPNPKVGRAAIELLDDYESPEILPAIEQALKSADEQTRTMALESLSAIDDSKVAELLNRALNDVSKEVRATALEVTAGHDSESIQLGVLERGITSPYHDVKSEIISMLQDRSDHIAVDILIEGLKDKDPKFREEINESLDFLIEKEFKTYEEAQAWWRANKDKYDKDTLMIND
jgi:hypothetical protein